MFNGLRIFAPPEFPVLSLEVQAHLPVVEAQEQSQFRLLIRHFLERFFNNDMVSADGETKARLLQVVYAIALPGMVVALFLFPLYHAPLERPFWSQVSDHYFYVLYSFVAVGAVSIFSWDLLFPDLLDRHQIAAAKLIYRRTLFWLECETDGRETAFCGIIKGPSDSSAGTAWAASMGAVAAAMLASSANQAILV